KALPSSGCLGKVPSGTEVLVSTRATKTVASSVQFANTAFFCFANGLTSASTDVAERSPQRGPDAALVQE
ncbi:hypothetical protein ATANTOWER_013545, partial [Ataeniobius toweri]|nr:hypothetical protein [Ataeniobius toweri]